jgi:hypothetical protein
MNHLPKFLLPCGIGLALLDNIINIYQNHNIKNKNFIFKEVFTGITYPSYNLLYR